MAFTTGTATDYHDLLDKLRLWLTGTAGWTQLNWVAPTVITDTAQLNIRGPGAGPDRQSFINIQSRNNPGAGAYGWAIRASTDFDIGEPWGGQESESPEVFFNTWENSIPYWFYANDRRFIVVAKVSSSYVSCYAGMYLPFALPSEHAFPLYVGGNYPVLAAHDESDARNRFIADPGDGAAYYRPRLNDTWQKLANHFESTSATSIAGGDDPVLWPFRTSRADSTDSENDWSQDGLSDLRPNVAGELPMWQCHIIDPQQQGMPGALDAVFATGGFGRSSEQTMTSGGRTFRLFQNINRSTERDFMAIEEL